MSLFRLTTHAVVGSTNVELKRLIDADELEGAVVRAYEQTGGYGRQGRAWVSPAGGMYQSLLLRPNVDAADVSSVTLVAGLAVCEAINAVSCGETFQVKWPNDIVCAEGKVCGISCELYHGALCIGIGVNVFEPADAPIVGGGNTPVRLIDYAARPDCARRVEGALTQMQRAFIDEVGDAVLKAFEGRYAQWREQGFAAFVNEYCSCMAMRGNYVEVENRAGGLIACGEVVDVDELGRLVLLGPDGQRTPVASGEAHIAKRS